MKLAVSSGRLLKLAGTFAALTLTYGLVKLYLEKKRCQKRKSYPKDVVILHQFPPHTKVPNKSPFCLKLETW